MGLGLLVFFWAGVNFAGTEGFSQSIYFALCLSVPSLILVTSALDNSDSHESLQGQISKGIAVVSSLCAIVFIAKLSATGVVSQISDSSTSFSGADSFIEFNLWLTERLVFLIIVLMVLSKLVLEPVVRYLLRSSELLFVSALGYCMGIASICGYIGISPEAGAFFAGISVGEISAGISPCKQ